MKSLQKQQARRLRHKGCSINQIADILNVSKGSVSIWVRDIALTKEAALNMKQRLQLSRERARETRLVNIHKKRKILYRKCKSEILPLSNRDLFIAGLMLYAGEGRKSWEGPSQPIELTNSDPNILRIFLDFLIKVCAIPKEKIKIRLFLYPDINIKTAESFWSKELGIPLKQFQKSFIKQSYGNCSHSRRSKYGTAHIVLCNADLYQKMLGWLLAVYRHDEIS